MVITEKLKRYICNIFHSNIYPIKQINNSPRIILNMCLDGILLHEKSGLFSFFFVNLMILAYEFIELI